MRLLNKSFKVKVYNKIGSQVMVIQSYTFFGHYKCVSGEGYNFYVNLHSAFKKHHSLRVHWI